ncbi:MAG: lysylphosphatidylglycerol synthase domain-containing protein [Bacteroidota bacterium]|nr:lysylphosphatidylglycerol synthase domain-containing protein [Bacteroidota bacterium]
MQSKKTISFLIKIGIVAFALFFLYQQLTSKSSSEQFNVDHILLQLQQNYLVIGLVILMMFLNWFLESLKWRFLISKIEKITIKRSIRAVFSGITVSAFTPNRVGEYAGRVFCLEKADRIQGVLITVIGSMAQLVITIVFGLIGILLLPNLMPEFDALLSNVIFIYPIMLFIIILLITLLVTLFLNASVLSVVLSKFKFLSKFAKYNEVFTFYNSSELLEVLLYSTARYIVFSTQFFILLQVFEVHISYLDAVVLTTAMLFVISVIPTIAITEIGVRGSVALFLFGLVSSNTIGILSATFVMWVINLLLPALIGTAFIFTLNFFRK